jgi:hypothetical protein
MSGPDQPDLMGLAEQQGDLNAQSTLDQTYANRAQQSTPFGYTDWSTESVIDPGTGLPTTKWNQTSGLTPELQELLNKQTALTGQKTDLAAHVGNRMAGEFGQPADYGGLNPYGANPISQYTLPESYEGLDAIGDPTQMRQRAEDAWYGKAQSRLAPQFDSQRQQAEMLQQRGSSLNEMNALLSGSQVGMPSMPSYNTAAASAPANVYQAGVDQGNYDQASSPWGGIADLGGTLGAAYLGRSPS